MPYDPGDTDDQYDEVKAAELVRALRAEEQWAASYLKSELQEAQIDALKRYYGDEYGDEVEGRSRVTTREVFETVEWLRPDLRRTFTAGPKVFEFEGTTAAADQYANQATDLVNHVFLNDNEGERELDAFIFDGLLHRVGILACEWKEAEYSPASEVSGLNTMQAQQLLQDPRTEILGQEVEQGEPDEAHPDGFFYEFRIRRRSKDAYPEVFCIAPEDFRIAARTTDLKTARYAGDVVRMMKGEAKKKWPEFAEEIDANQGDTAGFNTDERRAERFRDLEGWDAGTMREGGDQDAAEIEIMREYIRHDCDEDGYPELIRCYRLGETLFEYEEVDEHIYTHWTPIPIPHRFFGLGINDIAKDLQRTKTVLLRNMLDSVYQSVVPRIAADTNKVTAKGLDALLTVRPGVVIETAGAPSDALMPFQVPDLSASALLAMQWVDRISQSRTGVTREAQPMDPDALHDTARGQELINDAASIRKEEIARNLAVGLQQFGMKLYRLIHKHQNEARSIKVAGQWQNIDPRAWEADARCTVSVGLGTGAKDKQLAMLQTIQGDQVAWVGAYGPATPVVTPQHLHNLVAEKMRVMGFKSPDKFFGDPIDPQTGQPFVPQPPPNPDQQKVQAQIQEGQARLQMDGMKAQQAAQLEQMRAQHETNMRAQEAEFTARLEAAKHEAKTTQDAQKAQMEAEIARFEAEGRLRIAEMEAQLKASLAERQFEFERRMQEQEMAFKERIETRKVEIMAKNKSANGADTSSSGSSTQFGGEPG